LNQIIDVIEIAIQSRFDFAHHCCLQSVVPILNIFTGQAETFRVHKVLWGLNHATY